MLSGNLANSGDEREVHAEQSIGNLPFIGRSNWKMVRVARAISRDSPIIVRYRRAYVISHLSLGLIVDTIRTGTDGVSE